MFDHKYLSPQPITTPPVVVKANENDTMLADINSDIHCLTCEELPPHTPAQSAAITIWTKPITTTTSSLHLALCLHNHT